MEGLPEIITHNYDPARGPCRNLCDLPDAEAERILEEFRAAGRRTITPAYLPRRRLTENRLIRERRRKLGRTRLERPV